MEPMDEVLTWLGAGALAVVGLWYRKALYRLIPPPSRVACAVGNTWARVRGQIGPSDERFRFVLTWLANDSSGDSTRVVEEAFRDVKGVELSRSARTVAGSGAADEWKPMMRSKGQKLLDTWRADLAIVGSVKTLGKDPLALDLWIVRTDGDGTLDRVEKPYRIKNATLESKFRDHLYGELVSTAISAAAQIGNDETRYSLLEPDLRTTMTKLRRLIDDAELQEPRLLADLKCAYGAALVVLGDRDSSSQMLNEAVDAYEQALAAYGMLDSSAIDLPGTQINYGCALWVLSQRNDDLDLVEKAGKAFRSALGTLDAERSPLEWSLVQNNLGLTLKELGSARKDMGLVEEAVQMYESALSVLTRKENPFDWARTEHNLAAALSVRYGEGVADGLEQAIVKYRRVLDVFSFEKFPRAWAGTRHNLGLALGELGTLQESRDQLLEARDCFASIIDVKRDGDPLEWAETQFGLATSFMSLAGVDGDGEAQVGYFEGAIGAYNAALTVFTREDHPDRHARMQELLGIVLTRLGWIQKDVERLGRAVEALDLAVEIHGPESEEGKRVAEQRQLADMARQTAIIFH